MFGQLFTIGVVARILKGTGTKEMSLSYAIDVVKRVTGLPREVVESAMLSKHHGHYVFRHAANLAGITINYVSPNNVSMVEQILQKAFR